MKEFNFLAFILLCVSTYGVVASLDVYVRAAGTDGWGNDNLVLVVLYAFLWAYFFVEIYWGKQEEEG